MYVSQRQRVALHEAGHTAAVIYLGLSVWEVVLDPDGTSGHTTIDPNSSVERTPEQQLFLVLAGPTTETMLVGPNSNWQQTHGRDFEMCWSEALRATGDDGPAAGALLNAVKRQVEQFVSDWRDLISIIASELDRRGALFGDDVNELVSGFLDAQDDANRAPAPAAARYEGDEGDEAGTDAGAWSWQSPWRPPHD